MISYTVLGREVPHKSEFVEVRPQPRLGKGHLGVFTRRPIKAGEQLFVVTGPLLQQPTIYTFQYNQRSHIDPINGTGKPGFGHFTNHRCVDPTTVLKRIENIAGLPFISVVAWSDLPKDTHVTFDYASNEEHLVGHQPCKCASERCRGEMLGFFDLTPEQQVELIQKGNAAPYLLEAYLISRYSHRVLL